MLLKLIRQTLKPLKRVTKDKAYRAWLRAFDELKSNHINYPVRLKVMHLILNIHHKDAFLNQFESIFVDEIYRFPCKVKEPVIIDCGSNMGTSVLYCKSMYPNANVYAFEPDLQIFKVLQENIVGNRLKQVEAYNSAVWVNNEAQYFIGSQAQSGSIIQSESKVKVSCVRLKDFLSQFKHIHFLKLDIEGAELAVLNDIKDELHKIDHVFVEYHSTQNHPQELSNLLTIFEANQFRYKIHGGGVKSPFMNDTMEGNIDHTVDIFASRAQHNFS
jgi:FkbM family methyltransferase